MLTGNQIYDLLNKFKEPDRDKIFLIWEMDFGVVLSIVRYCKN